MNASEPSRVPHSAALLDTVNDAVHGPIDLTDECDHSLPIIQRLVNSPFLARLRLIKQLSYSSHFISSADHSRFAHALGTMHVMRQLLRALKNSPTFNSDDLFQELSTNFSWISTADEKEHDKRYRCMTQHMLLAALLQDTGELPSNIATQYFCYPGEQFREALKTFTFETTGLDSKQITGLGIIADFLSKPECGDLKGAVDWLLVFSLISGQLPNGAPLPRAMRRLYHLVDGDVDADRIDYVHRDAFHCLGEKVSPSTLIHSFVGVDENGPIFANGAAVSSFFLLRARLWSSVYLSPQNRFRLSLLLAVMRGALRLSDKRKKEKTLERLFGTKTPERMTISQFLDFHDHHLTVEIRELAKDGDGVREVLGQRAAHALRVLAGNSSQDYECVWITTQPDSTGSMDSPEIPHNVFFDTFSDYTGLMSFRKGAVRVRAPEFKFRPDSMVYLEEAGGPFSPWLQAQPCPVPMPSPYSVLAYLPRISTPQLSAFVEKCRTLPDAVVAMALEDNPFVPFELHDTRNIEGFKGPSIFVSFCWADILTVRRVLVALYQMKRRYFAITSSRHGIGTSAATNSRNAARSAEAAIILASKAYCERLAVAGSPLQAEVQILRDRQTRDLLKCPLLTVYGYQEVKDNALLKAYMADDYADLPFMSKALSTSVGWEFHEIVKAAVTFIDDAIP